MNFDRLSLVATLGLAAASASCSLALELGDSVSCSVDDDCQYGAGMGTCEDNVCRPPGSASGGETETDPSSTSGPTTTMSSTLTTESSESGPETTLDSSSSESTGTPVACVVNSECENDQRCSAAGECVELLTAQCQDVYWPDDRDNVVFIGSIMPTGEPFTNLLQPLENAVLLGVEDFNDETTLQGDRGVAYVRCDDTAGPPASLAAATHLVEDVGVAAIVGPIFSETVLEIANSVAIPAGTFMISPTASAMSVADLDDDDLVWRTIPGDVYQSNALVDRFDDIDDADGVDNLLVLAKDDAYGNGVLTAILADLEADLGASNVTQSTYPNPTMFDTQEELLSAYGTVLAGVAGDAPFSHVLFVGTSEIQVLLYAYLGALWDGNPATMPLFTFSHGAVPEMERFINEIGPDTGTEALEPAKGLLMANMEGTSPVVLNPANFNAFSIRYRIRFNDEEPLTSSALGYDATMATLFAMCRVPAEDEITGTAIAAGMPALVDGDTFISFSGSDLSFISAARNALAVDGTVDLQGVSGELQWDLETGDVRAGVWGWELLGTSDDPVAGPTSIYCLDPEPATNGAWEAPEAPPASCG